MHERFGVLDTHLPWWAHYFGLWVPPAVTLLTIVLVVLIWGLCPKSQGLRGVACTAGLSGAVLAGLVCIGLAGQSRHSLIEWAVPIVAGVVSLGFAIAVMPKNF